MTDDELAGLLGDAPPTPDPGFRFDVFERVTRRARRREAVRNTMMQGALVLAAGAGIAVMQANGFPWADTAPFWTTAGVLLVGYVVATLAIQGPQALLNHTRAALRLRI